MMDIIYSPKLFQFATMKVFVTTIITYLIDILPIMPPTIIVKRDNSFFNTINCMEFLYQ